MLLSKCYAGILAHSSLQNCSNLASLEGFQAWTVRLRSCQIIWTLTNPLQNLLSFSLFVFGAAGMFWIIVLLHSPSELELQGYELMVKPFLVETEIDCSINYNKSPWSSKEAPEDHITITVFDCSRVLFMRCCVSFIPRVTGLKHLGIIKMGFFPYFLAKFAMIPCVLFSQQWFSHWIFHGCHFF